jgi:magnesium-transporting ATPase (P-type)
MNVMLRCFFCFFIILSIFCLAGCGDSDEELIEKYKNKIENDRIEKLSGLRSTLSSSFLLGAILYVCVVLIGPSATEKTREIVAAKFKLSKQNQVMIANLLYWFGVVVVLLLSLFNTHLQTVKLSVFLLLGASAYPFFVHVLPSIETKDKTRMKAAIGQVKSFFTLIFIFYVILKVLSPEGFGEIAIR